LVVVQSQLCFNNIGTLKWLALWAGGRYSEVVVSSGLTVFQLLSILSAKKTSALNELKPNLESL